MLEQVQTKDKLWQYASFAIFFVFIALAFMFDKVVFSALALAALLPNIFYPYLSLPVMLISIYLGIFYLPFGMPLSFFIYALFAFSVSLGWLIYRRVVLDKQLIATSVTLILLAVIATLNSIGQEYFLILEVATSVVLLIVFSLYNIQDIKRVTRLIIFAAALFAVFNLVLFAAGKLTTINHRITILPSINVNSYGVALCQIGIVLAYAFSILRHPLIKAGMALLFFASAYLLFLTGSRTSALALAIMVTLILALSPTLKPLVKMIIFIVGLTCAGALFFFTDTFAIFLGRQGGFSGRTTIWKALILHIIPKNFWFGIGFSTKDMERELVHYGGYTSYAHNLVLSALAQGGIFFAIALALIIFWCAKKAYLSAKAHLFAGLPAYLLGGLLLIGIAEDIYISKFFWCIMGWAVMYFNSVTPKKEQSCRHLV